MENDLVHSSLQSHSTSSKTTKTASKDLQAPEGAIQCSACKRLDNIMVALQVCGFICDSLGKILSSGDIMLLMIIGQSASSSFKFCFLIFSDAGLPRFCNLVATSVSAKNAIMKFYSALLALEL